MFEFTNSRGKTWQQTSPYSYEKVDGVWVTLEARSVHE